MKKGLFITFEGIEACGKSTQAELLYRWLRENDIDALLTRDPGGTRAGEAVRKILLESDYPRSELTEALLYAAARRQLVDEVIRPSLLIGKVVICDRFTDSFVAYQGYGRGIDLEVVRTLNEIATSGIMPDITILLDLPVEVAFERLIELDRMEKEDFSFHLRVREGFLKIAQTEEKRIKVLDAQMSQEEIFDRVKNIVLPYIVFPV